MVTAPLEPADDHPGSSTRVLLAQSVVPIHEMSFRNRTPTLNPKDREGLTQRLEIRPWWHGVHKPRLAPCHSMTDRSPATEQLGVLTQLIAKTRPRSRRR